MNLNLTTATRYGLNCLALLGIAIALYLGRSIFVPLTIAALLAAIFWPSAKRLSETYRFPWFLACMTTVVVVLIFGLVPFVIVARAVPGVLADLPRPNDDASKREFYHKIREGVRNASPFDTSQAFPERPEDSGFYQYASKTFDGEQITNALLALTKTGYDVLFEGVLILFIFLFLLLEGEMLARKIRNIFGPGPDTQRRVTAALGEMAVAVRAYLVWRTIVNLGLAVVLGVVYHGLGLRQATLWAILTFILCYVPYLGTIAAGIPPILDALLYVGPGTAVGILLFYSAVVTFEGYVIVPWVMGRSMDLNATTVIMTCLFWDYVWGTAGLFLAMPLMAAIKAVCLQVDGWREWGQLMGSGEDAVLPSQDHPEMVADSDAVDYAQEKDVERNGDNDATVVMESLPAELEEQLARTNSSEFRPVPPPSSGDAPPREPPAE
jgi:predicted PurR-regulated permease PerM